MTPEDKLVNIQRLSAQVKPDEISVDDIDDAIHEGHAVFAIDAEKYINPTFCLVISVKIAQQTA